MVFLYQFCFELEDRYCTVHTWYSVLCYQYPCCTLENNVYACNIYFGSCKESILLRIMQPTVLFLLLATNSIVNYKTSFNAKSEGHVPHIDSFDMLPFGPISLTCYEVAILFLKMGRKRFGSWKRIEYSNNRITNHESRIHQIDVTDYGWFQSFNKLSTSKMWGDDEKHCGSFFKNCPLRLLHLLHLLHLLSL